METESCPVHLKCPVSGDIRSNLTTSKNYQEIYCNAGREKYTQCLRFKVVNIIGICPLDVNPDDKKTPEQILRSMQKSYDKGLTVL